MRHHDVGPATSVRGLPACSTTLTPGPVIGPIFATSENTCEQIGLSATSNGPRRRLAANLAVRQRLLKLPDAFVGDVGLPEAQRFEIGEPFQVYQWPARKSCRAAGFNCWSNEPPRDTKIAVLLQRSADGNTVDGGLSGVAQV